MKVSLRKGFSYGTTSGVITSLGLLIGLYSTGGSKTVILAGLLTIAFADALSDGLGMYISEESENRHSRRAVRESALSAAGAKMCLGISFVLPVLLLPLQIAVIVSLLWSVLVLSSLSYKIAKCSQQSTSYVITTHVAMALFVVIGSYIIGTLINHVVL